MEQEKTSYQNDTLAPVISQGKWIGNLLLMVIPLVNIVLMIVWALSKTGNPNQRNWARAMVILWVVFFVLYLVLFLVFGESFQNLMTSAAYPR